MINPVKQLYPTPDSEEWKNEEEKLRAKLQDVLNQYPVWGNGILTTSRK